MPNQLVTDQDAANMRKAMSVPDSDKLKEQRVDLARKIANQKDGGGLIKQVPNFMKGQF